MERHLTALSFLKTGKAQHLFLLPTKLGELIVLALLKSLSIWTCREPNPLKLMVLVVEKGLDESQWI